MIMHKTRKTARTVAALLYLATVGIVNTVPEFGLIKRGTLNQQQLVATDTDMPVRDKAHLFRCQADVLVDSIDHDEIIAEAVHLGELEMHG
jgi:hypothetical protein